VLVIRLKIQSIILNLDARLSDQKQRRTIKPKRFDDYINTNIVELLSRTIQSLSTESSVILSNIGIHSLIKLIRVEPPGGKYS
jgi:DNA modification methylase